MKGNFAIAISKHRILGPLINPVIVTPDQNREYSVISDRLSMANLKAYEKTLYPEQVMLVKIAEEFSDTHLLKIFSKKRISIQDFYASLSKDLFENQVRPYIERRIQKCVDLLSGSDIPVYFKKQLHNIYESDRIFLQEETAGANFMFRKDAEGIHYALTVEYCGEIIPMTGKTGFVLVNDPCVLLLENRIFRFDDIDGKKLLPFFNKRSIFVKKETEGKFLDTFVKRIIQHYPVQAEGIHILDRHSEPETILSLENNLSGDPVFALRFRYHSQFVYDANRKSELQVSLEKNNGQIQFIRANRDPEFEGSRISALLGLGLANIESSWFVPLNMHKSERILQVYDLVNWMNSNLAALDNLGIEVVQQFQPRKYYLNQADIRIKVSDGEQDWFDLHAVVVLNGMEIPFVRFRDHLLDGCREYELPDGTIFVLPEAWFSRFRDLLTFSKVREDQLTLEKQHFPLLENSIHDGKGSYAEKISHFLDQGILENHPVPEGLRASLRDYQKKGYRWLWSLQQHQFGGCLADDMGLGKTLQTLALLVQTISEEKRTRFGPVDSVFERQLTIFDSEEGVHCKVMPSLVVVPSSLVHNWMNEVQKFTPEIQAGYYGGQNRRPFQSYYQVYDLIITTYGLIRNDVDLMKDFDFLYLILDESQVIKNRHSKTYKAINRLTTKHRLVLTGTPIENSLGDLWAQMNFLNPGLLGRYEFFRNHFAVPIEKSNDLHQAQILKTLISPFLLRRTKSEVAPELPELSSQIIYCDMTEAQTDFYESEKSRARNLVLENILRTGIKQSSFIILQSLTRLRQAANHPLLIDPSYPDDSGKFNVILDQLSNLLAEKHKVLVFSSFVKHLDLFTDYCRRHHIPFCCLTGDVPQQEREGIIQEFQENNDILLFFISIKAGGFGLNLTAAEYVFILDPWWNPAVEEQAVSRAHRIGQKNKVFVYRYITKDTLEDKIRILQEKKSNLADKFINAKNLLDKADEEEIMNLFE